MRPDGDVRLADVLPAAVLKRPIQRKKVGDRAEEAVADLLLGRGFTLLAANLRLGNLELDLVARRGPLVVVVEVRTRGVGSFERALASVSIAKRRRLVQATERLWRDRLAANPGVERVRIDVAAVSFDGLETHIEYIAGALTA